MTGQGRPLSRGRPLRRTAPFVVAMALPFALAPLPPATDNAVALAAAAALCAAIALVAALAPWRRLPPWTEALPPLAYLGVVALLREAGGGAESGYEALALLPVLWLAIYGSARQVTVALAGVAAVFVVPALAVGSPDYPGGEWRQAAVWVAIAAVVGAVLQRLQRDGRAVPARVEDDARNIAAVLEATQTLSRSTDSDAAREAICEAVLAVSGGDLAALYEPTQDGRALVASAARGEGADALRAARIPFVGESSGATKAFVAGRPYFAAEALDNPEVSQRLVKRTGARSMYFQPVVSEGKSVGVLSIIWRRRGADIAERVGSMVHLLAAEAAVAIERAGLLARLEAVARTDDLTGLANRRSWDEELPRELARAHRQRQSVCVAMIDLDRFKRFNDELGHQAGDRLLKEAAAAWRAELRTTDTLARYGGEEFAALLPGCDRGHAVRLLERLRAATPGGQTCSAGVASWDGTEDAGTLVARADAALYRAKSAGRDCVVTAS
jgi:diguanylate cyclase (GGDEF)-like protein